MSKYRIIKKVILHDGLTEEQAQETLSILSQAKNELGLDIEEYIEDKYYGLGRDPDLHKDD